MRGTRSAAGVVGALLAVAGTAPGVAGAGVSRAAVSGCGSLSLGTGAPAGGGELTDAAFVSAGESWAIGDVSSALHASRTLIERFDGSGWSVIPSPNQGSSNNGLNGISMTSGGGWAAGYAIGAGGTYQPLALRWDGTRWSLDSPAAFASDTLFTGVDASAGGTAWAVGFQTSADGTRTTLIEHESNGAWTQVPSPNGGANPTDNTLMAISGTQATGLWAVGYWLSPTGLKPLILRYDTSLPKPSWVSVSGAGGVPSPGKVETVLTGVDVRTASDVWAVGYYDDGSGKRPLALHWDGSRWSSSPVPGAGMLRRVKAIAPGNVWSAGSYYDASQARTKTLLVHFDGTKWTTVNAPDANAPTGNEIIGVAADPAGSMITLVGRRGSSPLLEQASCPTGPVSLPTRPAAPVLPVPAAPGVGPSPSPPPDTPPATTPIPVTMTDQAAAAGIGGKVDWTFSAAVADINGDGWPDLFVARHWHPANLWLNNHDGTFSPSQASYFSSLVDRHSCVAADFIGNGRQGLFCSVGADRGTGVKSNALYIQQPDHTFVDQAYQWHVSDPTGRGRYSTVLDVNNDGYPDIFYGAESLRPDGLPSINRLYLNTGHGSMIDSPAMGLDLNIGSKCVHTVDYNRDGWPDLLICGDNGHVYLFRNNQGHGFQDVSSILGNQTGVRDALLVDVNHDSRPDLITLTGTGVTESLQRADGTFAPPTTILKVKGGASLAVGDVNGDNNPDIYVVCGRAGKINAPDYLLLGNASGGFTTTPIPQTTVGNGDRAYAIDYKNNGLTSFLVLNGQVPFAGPIQLITPQPTNAGRAVLRARAGIAPGRWPS